MIRSALPEERFFSAIQAVLKSETNWIARQNNLFCCAIQLILLSNSIDFAGRFNLFCRAVESVWHGKSA